MDKIKYLNTTRWPENLEVLENYVIDIIDNQNQIIDWIKKQEEKNKENKSDGLAKKI